MKIDVYSDTPSPTPPIKGGATLSPTWERGGFTGEKHNTAQQKIPSLQRKTGD
jgi:hypothetical protein